MSSTPASPKPASPLLDEEIELALEPFKELVPPEMIEHLRVLMAEAALEHPTAAALLRQLEAEPVVQASDVYLKDGVDPGSRGKVGGGTAS